MTSSFRLGCAKFFTVPSFSFLSSTLGGVTQISAGEHHTCGLFLDGTAKCWGLGDSGRLGDGNTLSHKQSFPVAVGGRFKQSHRNFGRKRPYLCPDLCRWDTLLGQ